MELHKMSQNFVSSVSVFLLKYDCRYIGLDRIDASVSFLDCNLCEMLYEKVIHYIYLPPTYELDLVVIL